jgi:hypothetical protein
MLEEKKYNEELRCIASSSLTETFEKSAASDADSHFLSESSVRMAGRLDGDGAHANLQ